MLSSSRVSSIRKSSITRSYSLYPNVRAPQVHIPKFCNWIARHDNDPLCPYNPSSDCLLCVFNRDLHLYWRDAKSKAGFEDRHDKDFNHAGNKMPARDEYVRWNSMDELDMADCNEFVVWLVDHGFPFYGQASYLEEDDDGDKRLDGNGLGFW